MTTPTQPAIEAARERLAKAAEAKGLHGDAPAYRCGELDGGHQTKALAIALQEMSDAVKAFHNAGPGEERLGAQMRLNSFILPDPVLTPEQQMDDEATKICAQFGFMLAHSRKAVEAALRRGIELAKVQP